jgi:hypothetical protein
MRRWLLKWNNVKLQPLSAEERMAILRHEVMHLDFLVQKGDMDLGERLRLISELYDMVQGKPSVYFPDGLVCLEKLPDRQFTESPEYPGWKEAIDYVVNKATR